MRKSKVSIRLIIVSLSSLLNLSCTLQKDGNSKNNTLVSKDKKDFIYIYSVPSSTKEGSCWNQVESKTKLTPGQIKEATPTHLTAVAISDELLEKTLAENASESLNKVKSLATSAATCGVAIPEAIATVGSLLTPGAQVFTPMAILATGTALLSCGTAGTKAAGLFLTAYSYVRAKNDVSNAELDDDLKGQAKEAREVLVSTIYSLKGNTLNESCIN